MPHVLLPHRRKPSRTAGVHHGLEVWITPLVHLDTILIVTVWMEESSGSEFQGLTSTRFQLSAATGPEGSVMFCGRLLCIGSAAANTPAVNGSFCWPLTGAEYRLLCLLVRNADRVALAACF